MENGIRKPEAPWIQKATDPSEPINPTGDHSRYTPTSGLTKREWMAGIIMQGMVLRLEGMFTAEFMSQASVEKADALIFALNKEEEK